MASRMRTTCKVVSPTSYLHLFSYGFIFGDVSNLIGSSSLMSSIGVSQSLSEVMGAINFYDC